ncbi:MAG TPA: hypothetical protein VGP72_33995 [Planctomycetota bacterium]
MRIVLALLPLFTAFCWSADSTPAPEKGETLVAAADAEKILATLPAFKDKRPLKARIETEIDDMLGKRVDKGELLLDRPSRILRKFKKSSWLLSGTKLQEYLIRKNIVYIKDFSKAPNTLRLLQAACTGDFKALGEIFDIATFKKETDGKIAYRFVLTRKSGSKLASSLYKRIQARVMEDGLFFHELEYDPDQGDKVVERYMDITAVEKLTDEDFSLDLPVDVRRDVQIVETPK